MASDNKLKIVLASGGTGGHIFPAEALAEELYKRGHKAILITDARREKYSFSNKNKVDVHVIYTKSASGGILKKCKAIIGIFIGTWQSLKLLKKIKPDVVVGFGGYPSLPTMLAAFILNIKTVIHEQNAIAGRVNRHLATFADRVATSFESVGRISQRDVKKIILTGNPVRPYIKAVRELAYPELQNREHLHILVTGGSQGAKIFSEVIPAAIISLPDDVKKRIRIDQQCRAEDIKTVSKIYEEAGINADLATFFTDISTRLANAHLVICRSGASTIAEITVAGRAAILVPYLHATDDHQTANAHAIADKGAAFLVTQGLFRADLVAEYIKDFLKNPETLVNTALNAFELGIIDADKKLADIVEGVARSDS
jgi:UDP-N-acetylglucosamine--N-acetylmuramyl-(pentapeptide) pyrophosphoryl-undecaprenol N-acetylglucosamine transferase